MDFILKKFLLDIRKWYEEHFDGFDLEERCELHCKILISHYRQERFITTDLQKERIKFLNEVQSAMNLEVIKQHNQIWGGETWVWSNVVNAGFCYGSMGVLVFTVLKEPVHTMRLNTSTRKDSVINSDREGGNFEEKEEKKKDCFW